MTPSRPLSILQVLRAPVGGLFRHVCDLTEGLAARGHAVGVVIDADDPGPYWSTKIAEIERIANLGVTRLRIARGPSPRDLGTLSRLIRLINDKHINVIHGHGAKGGALARLAGSLARRNGQPARFYTPHGGSLHFPPQSAQGRIYRAAESFLARRCEAIIFESLFARDGFASSFGLSSPGWPVIPNGLHPHEFTPVRRRDEASDFVFIGEMRAIKGVDILIEAMGQLGTRTSAVLIGSGPELQHYRQAVDSAGLAACIRFLPPMPAREAFTLGRVVVAPSRAESLPYLLLEAIAAGKPVIATRVGGVPEIFGPHTSALLAPGDVAALRQAMSDALAFPQALDSQAESLLARLADRFTVTKMVASIQALYCSKLTQQETSAA